MLSERDQKILPSYYYSERCDSGLSSDVSDEDRVIINSDDDDREITANDEDNVYENISFSSSCSSDDSNVILFPAPPLNFRDNPGDQDQDIIAKDNDTEGYDDFSKQENDQSKLLDKASLNKTEFSVQTLKKKKVIMKQIWKGNKILLK